MRILEPAFGSDAHVRIWRLDVERRRRETARRLRFGDCRCETCCIILDANAGRTGTPVR